MNKQIKNLMLVMVTILIVSACGQLEPVSAPVEAPKPVIAVTEIPTDVPATVASEDLAPENFDQYIGLKYPPLPDTLSPRFSMIIQGSDDNGLSLFLDGKTRMLWLSKLSHEDSSGDTYWEVMDVLDLSNLEAGLALLPDGCLLNGTPDGEIFVVGKDGKVRLAWRANTTLDVFEVIPIDGIQCDSDKAVTLT